MSYWKCVSTLHGLRLLSSDINLITISYQKAHGTLSIAWINETKKKSIDISFIYQSNGY